MPRYASNTSVSVAKSKAEIEQVLSRYGAEEFASGWNANQALIGFKMNGRSIRFILPMPDKEQFRRTPSRGHRRSDKDTERAWEQGCRQSWRALLLCVKAKLEAVEAGITTFEDEFMAHIMTPTGQTIGEWVRPQLQLMDEKGEMPKLLPSC